MTFVDLFSGKEKLQHSGDAEISFKWCRYFFKLCLKIKKKNLSYIKKSKHTTFNTCSINKNFLTCCPNPPPSLISRTYY